mmetsp:Transcript_15745/g.21077  ORF Transcript_15745/g.21077 Transcript_15745/m.21077 type:complete len:84 (-) Transcript_15745:951-1202(-)
MRMLCLSLEQRCSQFCNFNVLFLFFCRYFHLSNGGQICMCIFAFVAVVLDEAKRHTSNNERGYYEYCDDERTLVTGLSARFLS